MKVIQKINEKLLIPANALWVLSVLILSAPIHTAANPGQINPKQRIEREFRQLEAAISRCIHEEVLALTEFDGMNRALYNFMIENPGVVRIIRATAGGHTVNDVSAESPFSAPSRSVGNQRWFRSVNQNRRAYYSMDRDSTSGEISLFYAWPLMSGPERDRLSGAFAAMIDLTAQIALITGTTENMPPFQITFRGRPFFQHDWDDLDYNEEPLEIRGTQGLTIRTHKPMPTRLDPIPPSARTSTSFEEVSELPEENDGTAAVSESDIKRGRSRSNLNGFSMIMNFGTLIVLMAIAAMLMYTIKKSRTTKSKRFIMEDTIIPPPKPTENMVIVKSMADMTEPKTAAPDTTGAFIDILTADENTVADVANKSADKSEDNENVELAITDITNITNDDAANNVNDKPVNPVPGMDPQVFSKMLKLIKDEFVIIDKKITALSQRIEELEGRDRQ